MAATEAACSDDKEAQQALTVNDSSVPFFPGGFCNEMKIVLQLAWPLIVIQLCQWGIFPVGLIFAGHLDRYSMDTIALTVSVINVTVVCTGIGMSTACDTIFSQMFGGDNKKDIGICLQKSVLILGLAFFPICAIHLNVEAILNAVGQHPQISRMTAECMLYFIPGTLGFLMYISLLKYLLAQDILIPNVVIGIVANLWNALLNYLLVEVAEMGTVGSAISMASSYLVFWILTLLYIILSKMYVSTWNGWSVQCLLHWGTFLKLALYGFLWIAIEFYSFELGIFLAGSLGVVELGAQTVVYQFEGLWFMIPFGISVGASLRVGYFLGADRPFYARASGVAAYIIGSVLALCGVILFASLRNELPRLFSNDPEIVELAASIMPILALYCFVDTLGGIGSGILRGCGKQNMGAAMVALCFALGLGAAIPLVLKYSDIVYFWASLCVAMAFESLFFVIYLLKIDWQQQAKDATERTASSTGQGALEDSSKTWEDNSGSHLSLTSDYGSTSDSQNSIAADDSVSLKDALLWRLLTVLPVIAILPIGIIIRVYTAPAGDWDTESYSNTTATNMTDEHYMADGLTQYGTPII